MNKINEILNYGLLAELAYLKLEDESIQKDTIARNVHNRPKYRLKSRSDIIDFIYPSTKRNKLTDKEEESREERTGIEKNRVDIMINLLSKYKIIDFISTEQSDLQATLFQDLQSKEYVLAFRGTASITDIIVDIAMSNLTDNYNKQEPDALKFVKDMKEKHSINDSNLSFTGHSLGGILSQSLGIKLKIKAFAFNPLGTSNLVFSNPLSPKINHLEEVTPLGKLDDSTIEWANKNIITLSYNDIGLVNGDILSNFATKLNLSKHIGIKIDFFGENVGIGAGHSIITLNKLLEKQSDENLTTLDDIINFNKNQKTLFLDIIKQNTQDMVLLFRKNHKCLFAVQTTQEIKPLLSGAGSLIDKLNHKNIDSFMINANITEVEDKNNFNNKLYYNYEKNQLKVKVKDFKEAHKLIIPVIDNNNKLKKHNVIVELQGES